MKTYTNKRLGFRIDVPVDWPLPTRVGFDGVIFRPALGEVFNLLIGPLSPEPPLEVTERKLRQYAQGLGYTQLTLGRILVGGKEHVWARYYIGLGRWTKKYTIVFRETECAITATCSGQKTLAKREQVWDAIVTSFRLLPSPTEDEAHALTPADLPRILEMREMHNPLTYPEFYDEESRQQPGKKRNLKLIASMVPDFKYFNCLILVYQWDKTLSDEATKRLGLRAVAYIACAIYDAATAAGLYCQASDIPHGRRPAWFIEGEKAPISLTLSEMDDSDRTCRMTIGASMMAIGVPPSSRTHWERLQAGFQDRFSTIRV